MAKSVKNQYQHPSNTQEALLLQQKLREQIDLSALTHEVKYIAGADISFNLYEDTVYAGIIVLKLPGLTPVVHAVAQGTAGFPYVPGFLSFREIPSLLRVWELLPQKPDVVMVDGHGIAHPRRLGIATHLGLVIDCATIGCAKKVLTGKFQEPSLDKGAASPLLHQQEQIGWVLRSKNKIKPVFVSPGTGMSMQDALKLTEKCLNGYRLPEPTRQAHLLVNRFRRGDEQEGVKWYE